MTATLGQETAGLVWTARFADGAGGEYTGLLPAEIPADRAGLLVGRCWTEAVSGTPEDPSAAPTDALAASSQVEFIPVHPGELARVAVVMGQMVHVTSVVICPAGVDQEATALAFWAGNILRAQRDGQKAAVMCAVCPPLGSGRSAIPHEISISDGEAARVRHVWEVVGWPDLPDWLDSLAPGAGAGA
ncbi:hypothetical protein I6A60_12275 [Frankia sp. AgB1.9]|uniref:hypothetical protein n=1 Tax=unclassified Frankia TaxID=2632575 RepID=UPI0019346B24|nr:MULTISPECIES: hypothetical protein [unclassified Frankia]MBL7490223.1 hypothetical protein [Frankia sp. AgW1.1]MBL7548646.1 hypothetical protein [Frankia sp. AgB1.9]MBL7623505.1 hypothetical protein [Frankia sp. AgB1.8]